MPYTLYIADKNYSSWSLRPWILMKTLAIPFTEHLIPFTADNNWHNYRSFSPTGKVPCLVDGDITVWDSLAITEYLAETYPLVWPQEKIARAWARSASAEMHSGFQQLRNTCPMSVSVRVQLHDIAHKSIEKDLSRLMELWQYGLMTFQGPFLAGKTFTAVDAFFAPVVFRLQTYGVQVSDDIQRYINTLLALPAMQEWQQAALKEKIEVTHEDEVLESGVIIKDLRTA